MGHPHLIADKIGYFIKPLRHCGLCPESNLKRNFFGVPCPSTELTREPPNGDTPDVPLGLLTVNRWPHAPKRLAGILATKFLACASNYA
jgi:hypothetical protein